MNIKVLEEMWKLKDVKRAGWLRVGIKDPESVADHSFFVALLCMLLPLPKGIDREKLIKMALVHDLAEAVVGDIVWVNEKGERDEKLKKEKDEQELKVMKEFAEELGDPELFELFKEYVERKSQEAKILKEIDKLEMAVQAKVYSKEADTSEFFDDAARFIKSPEIRKIFEEVKKCWISRC